jgi:hypothetical protein
MHAKDIKAQVRKQLKTEYPNWKRLTKKEKKAISKMVLDEIIKGYDCNQEIETPLPELLGLENQLLTAGIMNLEEMERFIESHKSGILFNLRSKKRQTLYIKDMELRIIDDILDDQFINRLLSYDGYTPAMRKFTPSMFLRAELLKAIKYPEISYRKYCGDDKSYDGYKSKSDYMGMGNKQNRAFIGLPLNKKQMISHVQLSQFRNSLTFTQQVNLTVYILHHLRQYGLLDSPQIHCVDSTELAVDCQQLLAKITINGQKIRIYDDIDCDCGVRRKKRDKSPYVVGYRLHTLTAINAQTGYSIPMISLLAPANHHDSHFLGPLVQLGKAIGLDVKLVTADEAYHDKDGTIFDENDVYLVKPPGSKASLPENVDDKTFQVRLDDQCEIPMQYIGIAEEGHEFKCSAEPGQCFRACNCPKFCHIPIDNGYFQRLLYGTEEISKAIDIRKNGERPFNLLKKREGLEKVLVRSQRALIAKSTFTTIATLLLEIADTRRKKKKPEKKQMSLFDEAFPKAVNF